MTKLEGMPKFKTMRNSLFVIRVSSLFRHSAFVIRHF